MRAASKSNRQIVDTKTISIRLAHIYMTANSPSLAQTQLQLVLWTQTWQTINILIWSEAIRIVLIVCFISLSSSNQQEGSVDCHLFTNV